MTVQQWHKKVLTESRCDYRKGHPRDYVNAAAVKTLLDLTLRLLLAEEDTCETSGSFLPPNSCVLTRNSSCEPLFKMCDCVHNLSQNACTPLLLSQDSVPHMERLTAVTLLFMLIVHASLNQHATIVKEKSRKGCCHACWSCLPELLYIVWKLMDT